MLAPNTVVSLSVDFAGTTYPVLSVEDAAAKWCAFRESSMAGVSDIGNGVIVRDASGRQVAKISYNGRIWR